MDAKEAARSRIDGMRDELLGISHEIHANPELAFEEKKSSALLAETLSNAGFAVEKPACGMDTAFVAKKGSDPGTRFTPAPITMWLALTNQSIAASPFR